MVRHFEDVTGDGLLDLVALAPAADAPGDPGAGAVYVWSGGPGLSGVRAPDASLAIAGTNGLRTMLLEDVDGDGQTDVVAFGAGGTSLGGPTNSGSLLVWKGGEALAGSLTPNAILNASLPRSWFDEAWAVDVTGDGIRDLVAPAPNADIGIRTQAGALYVWKGGPGLAGRWPRRPRCGARTPSRATSSGGPSRRCSSGT